VSPQAQADARLKCLPPTRRGRRLRTPHAMASLESLWKEGRDNALSPLEQMKAWALRTAQRDLGGDKAVNYKKIAERVTKVGGGHPTREAHGHPVQCYQGEGKRGSLKCPCCGGQPLPSWHPNPSLEWGGGIGQTGRPSPAWGPPQAGGDWRPVPPLIYYYIEPNGTNPRPRV
jgi:hypothetical protein